MGSSSIDTSAYGLKTYTKPTDLGCTYDSTVYEIFTALPSGAQFICDVANLTDESWNLPNTYATIIVAKPVNASRGYIYLYTKDSAADFRAYTKNGTEDDLASLTWYQNIQNDSSHGSGIATGGTSTPIYINTSGFAAPLSATVGSSSVPVYMSSGTITSTGVDLSTKANSTYSNSSSGIKFYLNPSDTSTYVTLRMSGSSPYALSLVYTANGSNTIHSLMDANGNFLPTLKSAKFSDLSLSFTVDSTTGLASYSGTPSSSITTWTAVEILGVNSFSYGYAFCTNTGATSFSNSSGTVSISGFMIFKVDNFGVGTTVSVITGTTIPIKVRLFYY